MLGGVSSSPRTGRSRGCRGRRRRGCCCPGPSATRCGRTKTTRRSPDHDRITLGATAHASEYPGSARTASALRSHSVAIRLRSTSTSITLNHLRTCSDQEPSQRQGAARPPVDRLHRESRWEECTRLPRRHSFVSLPRLGCPTKDLSNFTRDPPGGRATQRHRGAHRWHWPPQAVPSPSTR